MKKKRGFLLMEVVLAVAMFMILGSGGVIVILSAWNSNRTAEEDGQALGLAQEGLEALRSMADRNYSLLVNTTGTGIRQNSSTKVWEYNGLGFDTTDSRFNRTVAVAEVRRDGTGNIVTAPAGAVDTNTKKVTSTVSWNFSPAKTRNVEVSGYFTNWRKSGGGNLVYGNAGADVKYRSYDPAANAFSTVVNTTVGGTGRNFRIASSPNKNELIAGVADSTGNLRIICYDGAVWTQEWTVAVGGSGQEVRFDVAYEKNSGDALVLYSTNSGTNELAFRTKPGGSGCGAANWSAAANFDSPGTNGVVEWVKMTSDRRPGSDMVAAIWADANSDLQAAIWNGSGWVQRTSALETSLEVVATSQDVDDFDVEIESLSGQVMVVWSNSAGGKGVNGVRYALCTGGTANCVWSGTVIPPTWLDDATNLDISANPVGNDILFASIGNADSDLQVGVWNGSSWSNIANRDSTTETPMAGYKLVATGWLTSGGLVRGIVVYNDARSTTLNYQIMTPGTPPAWSATANFTPSPVFTNPRRWMEIEMDPSGDQLMYLASDVSGGNRLFAKRLVMDAAGAMTWSNADGGSALETALGQSTSSPFSYVYTQQ